MCEWIQSKTPLNWAQLFSPTVVNAPPSSSKHNHSQNGSRWKHLVSGLCVATNPMAYELTSLFSTTGRMGRINSFNMWELRAKWLDNCWWLLFSVGPCFVLAVLKGSGIDAMQTFVDGNADKKVSCCAVRRPIWFQCKKKKKYTHI